MIRAILVGIITVIAMAAALLAAEDRGAPPLVAEKDRADLIVIDKSQRKLLMYQADEMIFQTRIALGADPVGDKRAAGDGRTPEGEFQISQRNDESKYYLSLKLGGKSLAPTTDENALIHGQPNIAPGALTLPGDWTDGDIAVSNAAMRMLWRRAALGTKVVVHP